MKKMVVWGGLLVAAAALSLPLSNLMHPPNQTMVAQVAHIQDPVFRRSAAVLTTKCLDCHSSQARIPFYADLPVARDIIQQDMNAGKARFEIPVQFSGHGEAFTDLQLARLEHVVRDKSMPPLRYTLLHWNARLSEQDAQVLSQWIAQVRTARNLQAGVTPALAANAITPLPLQVSGGNSEKIALGRRLFHDVRLSGDNTLSCASCHALNKGGTDRSVVSTGIRGQHGPINAPTVFNAVYAYRQFWDGRAANLVEQAAGPVHNPLEMGSNWPQVLGKLQHDADYVQAFHRLYPTGLTGDNIADAIATFETTLVTPNSRFDQYLRGNPKVLSQAEVRGYHLFQANCVSCHAGPALGGMSFEKMGEKADYFKARGLPLTASDQGRENFTHQASDRFFFKVPTLRNVAQTAPYFHDGHAKTLKEAVQMMARYQVGKPMTDAEINDLVSFLGSLTGEYEGRPVQ